MRTDVASSKRLIGGDKSSNGSIWPVQGRSITNTDQVTGLLCVVVVWTARCWWKRLSNTAWGKISASPSYNNPLQNWCIAMYELNPSAESCWVLPSGYLQYMIMIIVSKVFKPTQLSLCAQAIFQALGWPDIVLQLSHCMSLHIVTFFMNYNDFLKFLSKIAWS